MPIHQQVLAMPIRMPNPRRMVMPRLVAQARYYRAKLRRSATILSPLNQLTSAANCRQPSLDPAWASHQLEANRLIARGGRSEPSDALLPQPLLRLIRCKLQAAAIAIIEVESVIMMPQARDRDIERSRTRRQPHRLRVLVELACALEQVL